VLAAIETEHASASSSRVVLSIFVVLLFSDELDRLPLRFASRRLLVVLQFGLDRNEQRTSIANIGKKRHKMTVGVSLRYSGSNSHRRDT
jgi:hypothetical protein